MTTNMYRIGGELSCCAVLLLAGAATFFFLLFLFSSTSLLATITYSMPSANLDFFVWCNVSGRNWDRAGPGIFGGSCGGQQIFFECFFFASSFARLDGEKFLSSTIDSRWAVCVFDKSRAGSQATTKSSNLNNVHVSRGLKWNARAPKSWKLKKNLKKSAWKVCDKNSLESPRLADWLEKKSILEPIKVATTRQHSNIGDIGTRRKEVHRTECGARNEDVAS